MNMTIVLRVNLNLIKADYIKWIKLALNFSLQKNADEKFRY